jgi:hypothetical protein
MTTTRTCSLTRTSQGIQTCSARRKRVFYGAMGRGSSAVGCVTLCMLWVLSFPAQAFQNLDFEEANVIDLPTNQWEFVSVGDGLPGWSAYVGTNQLAEVGHNWTTLGSANVAILGPQYLNLFGFQITSVEGAYSAVLQDGVFADQGVQPASISQTGLIPSWAKSLQFRIGPVLGPIGTVTLSNMVVAIGGQPVTAMQISSNLFGCDVSGFAGLEEELRFTVTTNNHNVLTLLDAISFSTQSIPEPSTFLLTVAGTLLLWPILRRKRA